MKRYQIRIEERPSDSGHSLTVEGLADDYEPRDYSTLLPQYSYNKELPPYWSVGIAEIRCFTLPFAIYISCYDLCQWHDGLKNGDELVYEVDGQTFTIVVGTWPTCDAAQEIEQAFRAANNITREQAREA